MSQPLTVLLADSDPAARHVLRRVLLREFKSVVIEADNGIAVLEELDTAAIDAVVLDLKIPGLSGLEVLRDIRQSPRHRHLPVVIVTEKKDEASIKEAVALGVADYVLKDQHQAVIVERMRRVFSSERHIGTARAQGYAARRSQMLSTVFTLLVVDEDADFLHFCSDVFRSKYEVLTTASAAHAMAMSIAQPPNAILVGSTIGTMSQASFARRIRQIENLNDIRLIAVVAKPQFQEASDLGLFDRVAVKSFVPETFLLQFEQILRTPGVLAKIAVAMPGFRSQTISAVEQVFGMMLGTEVNILPVPPTVRDGLNVFVPISIAEQHADLLVGASVSEATGLELAARMLQSPIADLPADAAGSALAEILNMVGGRVQQGLTNHGLRAQIGLPATGGGGAPAEDAITLGFGFDSMAGAPQNFSFSISERESVAQAE
jgi:CheY-like chemotaxis protein